MYKKRVIYAVLICVLILFSSILFVSSLSDPTDNPRIIEKNKNKLNIETQSFLKEVKDKEQQKEFIIKFKDTIDESKLSKVSIEKNIGKFKIAKIKGKVNDVEELLDDSEIEFVELEQNIETLEETIPFNVKQIKADEVWSLSKGNGVKVAILDTGIASHLDLSIAGGHSVVSADYNDNNGHGTAVAGVISALINNEGLVGVSPEIELYAVKIMESSSGSLSDAIAGLEWAIDNNMSIVSMSFGFDSYSQIFKEVLQEAYDNNILLIASAGNNGKDNILYPARYNKVIAVGAVDKNNARASFSSYGFDMELTAPGVDINSTSLNNQYSASSGTSMSAPHVTGVAALIKSFNNSLTNVQIRNKLRNDALDLGDSNWDLLYGYGLVQANLYTFDFTGHDDSYFYEIYNITHYNTPLQENIFWTEAQGHIDDVYFNHGIYLVNITKFDINQYYIYNVSENGSIFILLETIGYSETFSTEGGTTSDGVGWINEDLNVLRTDTGAPQVDVECFDLSSGPNFPYDYCYAINSAEMTDCDNDFTIINCGSGTTCDDTNKVGQGHPIIGSSSVGSGQTIGEFFWGCGGGLGEKTGTTNSPTWYVVSKKRARCTSTTAYVVEGWYGGGNWKTYDTDSCATGTTCVDTQNYTSKTANINPCQVPQADQVCSGTISSIATDSKNNPLKSLKVYRNSILNGTTDDDGSRSINFTNVVCGSSQTIEIKCSDNTTCDTKSSSIDSNDDYDSLSFTCNICINKTDLSIKTSDVTIKSQGNKHNITSLIIVEKVTASNVKIDFRGQNLKSDVTQNETKTISVSNYVNQNVSVLWDLNQTDFVSITVDFSNIIAETDEQNNYIKKAARPASKAYVDISTDYSVLTSVIQNYLDDYIDIVSSGQDVNIYIGRKNTNIPKEKQETRENPKQRWELSNNLVSFNAKSEGLPYNGLVVKDGINIYVFGNEIDGDLAALRKLVDNQEFYFSKSVASRADYIGEEDLDGLFVFDYLHTDEKQPDYRKNNNNFAKGVENVLNSDVYSLAIKRVLTTNDNTSLRIKHVNAELGSKYKNFSLVKPVVISAGIFNNLFTFEDFGFELARGTQSNKIRDTWLIEITGGPNTECSTCPNYRYEDLVDFYWPALISGIEKYSNENKIDYVGFSNGCRVALDSLKNWSNGKSQAGYYHNGTDWVLTSLSGNVVDTFVGVACPGAFEGNYDTKRLIAQYGNKAIKRLQNQSKTHITKRDFQKELCKEASILDKPLCYSSLFFTEFTNDTISLNLQDYYVGIINSTEDKQPGIDVNINNFAIYYGSLLKINNSDSYDYIISSADIKSIYQNINSSNKKQFVIPFASHGSIMSRDATRKLIAKTLNNESLTFFERFLYLERES